MCSNRCAMPVIPGRSFALPTCATQPPAMVGSSCRSTSRRRMPFGSSFSVTGTFWASSGKVQNKRKHTRAPLGHDPHSLKKCTQLQVPENNPASTPGKEKGLVKSRGMAMLRGEIDFMKKISLIAVLLAGVLAGPGSAKAQMMNPGQAAGLNAAMLKLFGELTAFSSKATLRTLDKTQKQTMFMPINFALLDGKVRMDIDLNQLKSAEMQAEALTMLKQMGMDKMTTIIRPDKKSTLLISPILQGYAEMPLSKQEADAANKKYQST